MKLETPADAIAIDAAFASITTQDFDALMRRHGVVVPPETLGWVWKEFHDHPLAYLARKVTKASLAADILAIAEKYLKEGQ